MVGCLLWLCNFALPFMTCCHLVCCSLAAPVAVSPPLEVQGVSRRTCRVIFSIVQQGVLQFCKDSRCEKYVDDSFLSIVVDIGMTQLTRASATLTMVAMLINFFVSCRSSTPLFLQLSTPLETQPVL
jgi:hypothetical protein